MLLLFRSPFGAELGPGHGFVSRLHAAALARVRQDSDPLGHQHKLGERVRLELAYMLWRWALIVRSEVPSW